jgi:protein-histidine pros-kinase
VEISLSPLVTEEGNLVSSAIRDISDRKQYEQALREKTIELEAASRAKDRFLTSMSHELRTPLNAVIGFTGTLLMKLPGPLNGDQEKQLRTIQSSARHLLSLINDLLDLAKVESGKVELRFEPVECRSVLESVAASLRPRAESKGLAFAVRAPREDLVIATDRRALTQILLNLANNAIKFTEQGCIELAVEPHRDNGRSRVEFRVVDTGVGIRPEDQARLYGAFERLGTPGVERQEGTGLGLHLSQRLAGLLRGRIECSSTYGQGSTFTLVIEG